MKNYKAIVFDFGNVIINIDFQKVYEAFAEITFKPTQKVQELFDETRIFQRYESNEFSDDEFRDFIRSLFLMPLTDTEIDQAWNAILLDIPQDRIKLLQNLKKNWKIYLLSNTNAIHIKRSNQILHESSDVNKLDELFEHLFLSYEMEKWKPDPSIYQKMLQDLHLEESQILFFDDNDANVASARQLGIETVHILPGRFTILDYFSANAKDFGL